MLCSTEELMLERESAQTVQQVGHTTQIPMILPSKLNHFYNLTFKWLKTASHFGEIVMN